MVNGNVIESPGDQQGQDSDARASEIRSQGPIDMTPLLSRWDPEKRSYRLESEKGPLSARASNYEGFQFRIRRSTYLDSIDQPLCDRVTIEIGRDPAQFGPTDALIVMNGGWGEPSSLFDGSFASLALGRAVDAGYQNLHYVGFNSMGMGTPGYQVHRNSISHFGLEADLTDSGNLYATYRKRHPEFEGDIHFMGHSLGTLRALRQMRAEFEISQTRARVRSLIAFNGMVGSRTEFLQPRPLRAVWPHVPSAVAQSALGRGCLDLSAQEKARIMLGQKSGKGEALSRWAKEYDERSVPGSARTFLQLALPTLNSELATTTWHHLSEMKKVSTWFVESFGECLLPDGRLNEEDARRKEFGLPRAIRKAIPGAHGLPVTTFSPSHAAELGNVFAEVFATARQ